MRAPVPSKENVRKGDSDDVVRGMRDHRLEGSPGAEIDGNIHERMDEAHHGAVHSLVEMGDAERGGAEHDGNGEAGFAKDALEAREAEDAPEFLGEASLEECEEQPDRILVEVAEERREVNRCRRVVGAEVTDERFDRLIDHEVGDEDGGAEPDANGHLREESRVPEPDMTKRFPAVTEQQNDGDNGDDAMDGRIGRKRGQAPGGRDDVIVRDDAEDTRTNPYDDNEDQ